MGASVIAAVAARARRGIIDHLRLARALDASSAVAEPELPSFVAGRQLQRLERAGVVRRAPNGGVYLDEHAYVIWRDGRKRRVLVLLLVGLVVLAGLLVAQGAHIQPPRAS